MISRGSVDHLNLFLETQIMTDILREILSHLNAYLLAKAQNRFVPEYVFKNKKKALVIKYSLASSAVYHH